MRLTQWFLFLCTLIAFNSRAAQPNVVFILTDDQAPWALGLFGHPHANTPNLDKLFKQGMWLEKLEIIYEEKEVLK